MMDILKNLENGTFNCLHIFIFRFYFSTRLTEFIEYISEYLLPLLFFIPPLGSEVQSTHKHLPATECVLSFLVTYILKTNWSISATEEK